MNIIELKNIRKKLKLSREDMARDISISIETLNNWEYRFKEIPEDKVNSIKYVYKTYFENPLKDTSTSDDLLDTYRYTIEVQKELIEKLKQELKNK